MSSVFRNREAQLRRQLLVAIFWVALYLLNNQHNSMRRNNNHIARNGESWHLPVARICNYKTQDEIKWVMFMGDSNMRSTYYWWTQQFQEKGRVGIHGKTYGLARDDIGFSGKWADQEFLYPSKNDFNATVVKRFSMRFLHGSINEFLYDTENWDIARFAYPSADDEIKAGDPAGGVNKFVKSLKSQGISMPDYQSHKEKDDENSLNWDGRINPSDYAIWATRYQTPIENNSEEFNYWMDRWEIKDSPDVVILTEGWLGVPRPEEFDIVRSILQNNPETLFIWSPIYVTGSTQNRYNSYLESGVFNWSFPNLRMVDLWDQARDEFTNTSKAGRHNHLHISVGGPYMKKAMKKMWNEVGC